MLCGSGDAYLQPVCVCMCVRVIYHYFDPSKSMFEDLIDIHGSNRLLESWGKERGGVKEEQSLVRKKRAVSKGKYCRKGKKNKSRREEEMRKVRVSPSGCEGPQRFSGGSAGR